DKMSNPVKGISYFFSGLSLVMKPGIRQHALWPMLINTVLFIILTTIAISSVGDLIDWMLSFLPSWLDFLRYILWPFLALASMIILVLAFSIIANLIAAPFNAALAAAVERHLGGANVQSDQTIKGAMALIMNEVRKIIYFLVRAIPLLILFLIPGVNIVAPFIWLFFGAWILTIEYADYPMGNHDLIFSEQKKRLKNQRAMSLGFGLAVAFSMMVPLLNFIVMPVAVAGATKMWVEDLSK
ncbi:MAG: sulfate transporter CysZ, partial [Gammaproteobacteria bacterium]|nr:sulfate transporter CysZ [Gammaproteobacteria bacterium]